MSTSIGNRYIREDVTFKSMLNNWAYYNENSETGKAAFFVRSKYVASADDVAAEAKKRVHKSKTAAKGKRRKSAPSRQTARARRLSRAAAKHGVMGIVRSLALEVARGPVTVNAICPGFLDTDMTEQSIRVISEKTGRSPAEARAALESLSPQNRLYRPDEVTAAALWLCGEGSDGMNGQGIVIAGGEV